MTQPAIEANVAKLARAFGNRIRATFRMIMLGRSYVNLEKYSEASNAICEGNCFETG